MFLNVLNGEIRCFLQEANARIIKAMIEDQLQQPILKNTETQEKIAKEAFQYYSENKESVENISFFASISGAVSITSILSGLALNVVRNKGKITPFVTRACFITGFVLALFWLVYRNCSSRLTSSANQALLLEKDDEALDLFAKGATFSKEDIILTAKKGCILTFIYLSILGSESKSPSDFRKAFIEIFHNKEEIDIKLLKASVDFAFGEVFDANHRANESKVQLALRLGVDPNHISRFPETMEAARLTTNSDIKITDPNVLCELLSKHCTRGEKDDKVISELIDQGASAAFGIEDYEKWEKDLSSFENNRVGRDEQSAYKLNQLEERSPFEKYINKYHLDAHSKSPITSIELIQILRTFRVYSPELFENDILKDSDTLWKTLNNLGLRIRKNDCQRLFQRLEKAKNSDRNRH